MAKMRVYEYAKAINVSSKEILTALKNMDIVVNNHMAMLEEKTIKQLDAKFKKGGAGVTSQKPAETNKTSRKGLISSLLGINQTKFETERRMTCRIINLTKTRRITTTTKTKTNAIITTKISISKTAEAEKRAS
ncbi:Translation initiation factor IF-2 [Bacillus velezensis]|nr:Translation initiation factor IF-2 [Bacillus velezensis]